MHFIFLTNTRKERKECTKKTLRDVGRNGRLEKEQKKTFCEKWGKIWKFEQSIHGFPWKNLCWSLVNIYKSC
jgi:hypothetical protein